MWRKDKVCLEIELLYSFPFQGFFSSPPSFRYPTFHASPDRISIQLEPILALPSIQTFLVRCRSGNCLINLRIGQQPPPCHPFWRVLISPRSGTRYRAPLIFFNGVDNLIAVITLERSPRVNPVFRSPFSFVTGLVTSPPLLSLFVNEVNERGAVPEKGWEQRRVFIWQFNSKNKRCVTL